MLIWKDLNMECIYLKIGINTITNTLVGDKYIKNLPPQPTKMISPWINNNKIEEQN
jgi:hypothetical protein